MALAVIIAVLALPILEIILFIKIGGAIGVLPLLALLVVMAIVGGMLLRHQGMAVARRAMHQVERNEPPVQAVVDGIGLSLAGVLMVIPGLITDVVGLLLLVPAIRRPLVGRLLGLASLQWETRSTRRRGGPGNGAARGPQETPASQEPSHDTGSSAGIVIEGEFERLEERTVRPGHDRDRDKPAAHTETPKDRSPWRQ